MAAPPHPPLAVIGGGNMAQAILRGAVAAGVLDPSRVAVAEPDESKRGALSTLATPIATAAEAISWLARAESTPGEGQILLAVKPQMLTAVAGEVSHALAPSRRIVISILAGTPTPRIQSLLGRYLAMIRVMPNLPASIGQGATAIAAGAGARDGDEQFAQRIFSAVGPVVVTTDESLMDAFTAVAGSGPAYLFYLAEAMARAATDLGFDAPTADRITRQTLLGAATMLAASGQPPADLRAAVTSKGGTTEAAISALDSAGVMATIIRAITAARDRGRELAGG
jgi:pyrroline-5-carboxylate reductase